ncbi:18608_t:CDS:2, partial [Funneliformis geosporum]
MDIIQGLRESVIPGTPEYYVNIYTVLGRQARKSSSYEQSS